MTSRLMTRFGAVLALVILIAPRTSAQTRRAMTIDAVLDLAQVTAPRISPDGARVLYTVSELAKWKDNKRVTSIWMSNTDGTGARRFLAHERDRSPAWSPAASSHFSAHAMRCLVARPTQAAAAARAPAMPARRSGSSLPTAAKQQS